MNYEELKTRVAETLPSPEYAVAWYNEAINSEANYTIVPLPDGRFTLYRPSGRGENYQDLDENSNPRIFETEDAVCDYVWAQLMKPAVPKRAYVEPDAAYLAEKRRKLDAKFAERAAAESGQ